MGKIKDMTTAEIQATLNSVDINKLSGKTFSILGDSISTYEGYLVSGLLSHYPSGDVTDVSMTWWGKLISSELMELCINNSYGGIQVANSSLSSIPMSDISRYGSLSNSSGDSPDYIFFFGGTNDFGYPNYPVELGEYNFGGTLDLSKFKQAYRFTVEELQRLHPSSIIVCITPPQRGIYEQFGNGNPPSNTLGLYLYEYCDVIREVSEMYGCKLVDFAKCGMTYYNTTSDETSSGGLNLYSIDGVHPNAAGMSLMSDYIKNELINDL